MGTTQWLQLLNYAILMVIGGALVALGILVSRDARRRGHSAARATMWGKLSVVLFPVGLAAYLVLRERQP